jgi:hypothetical protein
MLSVRQELRPVVMVLLSRRIERRERRGVAASGRHSMDRPVEIRGEQDDAVPVPGSASILRRVAESLWRTAGSIDFLQLSGGEEADEAAIRRPEREGSVLGSRHGAGFGGI